MLSLRELDDIYHLPTMLKVNWLTCCILLFFFHLLHVETISYQTRVYPFTQYLGVPGYRTGCHKCQEAVHSHYQYFCYARLTASPPAPYLKHKRESSFNLLSFPNMLNYSWSTKSVRSHHASFKNHVFCFVFFGLIITTIITKLLYHKQKVSLPNSEHLTRFSCKVTELTE